MQLSVSCVPGTVLGAEDMVMSTTARPLHPEIPNLYPGTVLCKHILHKKEWILVFTMQEEILSLVSLLLFVEYLVSEKQFGNNIFLRDLSQAMYFLTFNLLLFPKLFRESHLDCFV